MDDPLAAAHPGQRWSIRRRLPDGSATDVIGWIDDLDAARCRVSPGAGRAPVEIERATVVTARRAPAAAGGPPASRTSAAALEQIAMPGWVADVEPLGDWTLRSGGGFTSRANTCLAVGDPGVPLEEAARRVVAYAHEHGARPWVQAVVDSTEDRGLRELGWRPVYVEVDVLAVRLADLLGSTLPDPRVTVSDDLAAFWSVYAESRPYDTDPAALASLAPVVRRILDGVPPRAYGTVTLADEVIAIGRGHLNADWLGLSSIWTRPDRGGGGRVGPRWSSWSWDTGRPGTVRAGAISRSRARTRPPGWPTSDSGSPATIAIATCRLPHGGRTTTPPRS